MLLNRIVQAALTAAVLAAAAGQLPRLLYTVRPAQLQLLKDTESKKWGRPFLLPIKQPHQPKPRIHR